MIFKTKGLEKEFFQSINDNLRMLLWELDCTAQRMGLKDGIQVTCLLRTKEKNEEVGGHPCSAHLVGRAADLSVRPFSGRYTKLNFLIQSLQWGREGYWNGKGSIHKKGTHEHIHLQIGGLASPDELASFSGS